MPPSPPSLDFEKKRENGKREKVLQPITIAKELHQFAGVGLAGLVILAAWQPGQPGPGLRHRGSHQGKHRGTYITFKIKLKKYKN